MVKSVPASVLVVRTGAIGDVVNALVFASALKDAHPATTIGWVTHDQARPLLVDNPVVDRVHHWPRKSGLAGFRRVVGELRAARYDLAVDLQRIAKSAALARLAGIPRRIGLPRSQAKEGSWLLNNEHLPAASDDQHMLDRYLAAARYLGVAVDAPRWSLPADRDAEMRIAERLAGARPVLVNLGASKPKNRWTDDGFAEVAERLAESHDAPVLLTGGPGDVELFQAVRDRTRASSGIEDWVGATSLAEFAALTRHARTMVTCDTGPMHIAVSQGLKVAALFGPGNPSRTGPYGEGHRLVRPPEGETSTSAIRPDDVLAAVQALLAATPRES